MAVNSIISKCKPHVTPVVWLMALVVTAGFLLGYERHVLWKIQEQNLFLDTPLFFRQQMVVPGGLLTYVGSFLTQLFPPSQKLCQTQLLDLQFLLFPLKALAPCQ